MGHWTEITGDRPRLLVGDAQPLVGAALAALLVQGGHDVVGCVGSGAEAEAAILADAVDIAILDIDLADPSPLDLVTRLRQRARVVPVIIVAPDADHPATTAAIRSGADGLVLKSRPAGGFDHCLAVVIAGGQWFDGRALVKAVDRDRASGAVGLLTPREAAVARSAARGQRNRAIADDLGISEGTVKMHLHNIFAKLGLENRTQLATDDRLQMLD